MLDYKGWDSGNFPQLELNFLIKEWTSFAVFPNFVVDLEEIQGLEKNLEQEK